MSQGSQARDAAVHSMIDPPSWLQCLMALTGVVLLVGPTLAVLWPR